ncbi:MAG: 16S rRNA (cytidine(1402)-2'-O)-methyltransferase, partial [Elusimicrobia bacterium]|nr:16S rRNA (cytidine(1402)-2'-O)-methyltransferase [Elusimicrobiota bacterium]
AAALDKTVVVYESPFRVAELLAEASDVFGPDAPACAAREISKVYEEWISGSIEEVKNALARKSEVLGEFVVLFHPAKERANGRHHQA